MPYTCKACGEEKDSLNALRAHVQMSTGDHGDHKSLPQNWRSLIDPPDDAGADHDEDADDVDEERSTSSSSSSSSTTPWYAKTPTQLIKDLLPG